MQMSPHTLTTFQKHNWPGNVRELRNAVERLAINSLQNFSSEYLEMDQEVPGTIPPYDYLRSLGQAGKLRDVMKSVEKQYVYQVLHDCGGRIGEAADKLGIYRTVLYRKLKSFEEDDKE